MSPRRILLVETDGPVRDALARALSLEGHEVWVTAVEGFRQRLRELDPDTVVGRRELLQAAGPPDGVRTVALTRPVNLAELRRALRGG